MVIVRCRRNAYRGTRKSGIRTYVFGAFTERVRHQSSKGSRACLAAEDQAERSGGNPFYDRSGIYLRLVTAPFCSQQRLENLTTWLLYTGETSRRSAHSLPSFFTFPSFSKMRRPRERI